MHKLTPSREVCDECSLFVFEIHSRLPRLEPIGRTSARRVNNSAVNARQGRTENAGGDRLEPRLNLASTGSSSGRCSSQKRKLNFSLHGFYLNFAHEPIYWYRGARNERKRDGVQPMYAPTRLFLML